MILQVKEFKQTRGYCGPASLKIVMHYHGSEYSERTIAVLANSSRTEGTPPSNLVNAARTLGFSSRFRTGCSIRDLEEQIEKERPAIIGWLPPYIGEGHYSVVIGFDRRNLFYIDPFFGETLKMSKKEVLQNWYDFTSSSPPKNKSEYIHKEIITVRRR
ncbi:MAG: C39 family peptidase [Nanoarchaeota archaeon]